MKRKELNIIILVFFCFTFSFYAQNKTPKNSFYIQNNSNIEKEQYFVNAITEADMESYRLKDRDVVLAFSEGFECVLLSATKIAEKGIKINLENYQLEFSYGFILPIFSITNDNKLIATYKKKSK